MVKPGILMLKPEILMGCLEYGAHVYSSKNPGCYPLCGVYWWNEWKYDVPSWMKASKISEYYELLRRGENGETSCSQQAHQMLHHHGTYCFYLGGPRYLMQTLLQLPILAQCTWREPDRVEVPALGRWIADLQNHQESDEYKRAVQKSQKRSDEHRRLSQQIWKLSRDLTKAKTLAIKRDKGEWDNLIQDEQGLVEALDARKLHRRLQNLVEEKTPVYKGVGASMVDLQKDKHWCQRRC